jgi:membrane-bound lytic murein transglycosylase MltF
MRVTEFLAARVYLARTMRPPSQSLIAMFAAFVFYLPAVFAQSAQSTNPTPQITAPTQSKAWTGDLDVLLKHRFIRVAVPYSKTFYYTVKGVQWGVSYEAGKAFETYLNTKYPQKNKNIKIHVMFFVTPRDKVIKNLNDGFVDVAIAGLTITPERLKLVDFSDPTVSDISEVVVTGPTGPQLSTLEDLAGKEVFLRKTSSYWEHLETVNERFKKENKPAIKLSAVPEDLGDEDLLQMINAGLLPTIVVNDWTAKLWDKLLTKIQVHSNVAVATGGSLGWAVRKNSPQFLADINDFVRKNRQGTKFGKEILARYTGSTYMLKQAVSPESMKRFDETAEIFRKYGSKYSVDYLLMMAKGFQESGLNQNVKSPVGAIGVMQLMPATGKEMNVGDISQVEPNIQAGIKYSDLMMEKYYGKEPVDDLNKILFAFAAYNCGPARVKQLRAEAAQKGLDPNVWINNVEIIAAARVGAETVNYVSNIYKYYVAYKLIAVQEEQRKKARESIQKKPS